MKTLADIVEDTGPMPLPRALGWTYRLAKGVVEFHRFGVTHGSISPLCVKAAGPDCDSPAGLVDPRDVATLPAYHSLHRLQGGGLSRQDDCWAIVATFYCLVTGKPPFPGLTAQDVQKRIKDGGKPAVKGDWGEDPKLLELFSVYLDLENEAGSKGAKQLVAALVACASDGPALKKLAALEQRDGEEEDVQQSDAVTVLRTLNNLQDEAEQFGASGVLSEMFARLKPGVPSGRSEQLTHVRGEPGPAMPTDDEPAILSDGELELMPDSDPLGENVTAAKQGESKRGKSKKTSSEQAEAVASRDSTGGPKALDEEDVELGVDGTVVMKMDEQSRKEARALRAEALAMLGQGGDESGDSAPIVVRSSDRGPSPQADALNLPETTRRPSTFAVAVGIFLVLGLALALATLTKG